MLLASSLTNLDQVFIAHVCVIAAEICVPIGFTFSGLTDR